MITSPTLLVLLPQRPLNRLLRLNMVVEKSAKGLAQTRALKAKIGPPPTFAEVYMAVARARAPQSKYFSGCLWHWFLR